MIKAFINVMLLLFTCSASLAWAGCYQQGVWLQVLGSGGPELNDKRASSGYVVWHNGHARLLVDLGSGSLLQLEHSGAKLNDIEAILFSHLHVDHSNDLPAFVKASFFTNRQTDLKVYGPSGNHAMPSMSEFMQALFGKAGAYRYLNSYLEGRDSYRLLPVTVDASHQAMPTEFNDFTSSKFTAVPVHHGPIPALAWRIDLAGKVIVFSGDMSNKRNVLASLARQANLLVAHYAINEISRGVARNLHMPPSEIGKIAQAADVTQIVLSHRMQRTPGEKVVKPLIAEFFKGPISFAEDLQCFEVK